MMKFCHDDATESRGHSRRLLETTMAISLALLPGLASLPCDAPSSPMPWRHAGPGGYANSNDMLKMASAGAAQALVNVHDKAWLMATANGGIWKTEDILTARPHWSQVLDGQPVACTSISAMASLGSTVLAGCGSATSSEMGYDWTMYNSGDCAHTGLEPLTLTPTSTQPHLHGMPQPTRHQPTVYGVSYCIWCAPYPCKPRRGGT